MGLLVSMRADLEPVSKAVEGMGVGPKGHVQEFLTARVLHRMRRFMPWLTGEMATGQTSQQGPATIVVDAPQARYLYMGSKMRDPNGGGPFPIKDEAGTVVTFRYRKGAHPVATGVPLSYTHDTNPYAGDHWDKTLMREDGDAIAREVEEYARRMA